jgi:hypothetical protein
MDDHFTVEMIECADTEIPSGGQFIHGRPGLINALHEGFYGAGDEE